MAFVLSGYMWKKEIRLGNIVVALFAVAMLFALPAAAWLLRLWLTGFATHIPLFNEIWWWTVILLLVVTFLTILSQSFQLWRLEPTKLLKEEYSGSLCG